MPGATLVRYVYACPSCTLEFEDVAAGPKRRTYCPECAHVRRLARNRAWKARKVEARENRQDVVVLSDGHPVMPILAAWVNHDCALRHALAALRTGRYAEAEAVLLECLPDATPRRSVA